MFYPEFTVIGWLAAEVIVAVFAGVFWAMGAEYIGEHMINFYPEVGIDAITEREAPRVAEVRELKKAA